MLEMVPAGKRMNRMIWQDVSRESVEARVLAAGRFKSERQPICRHDRADDVTE
jgi:hypothetical protein